MKPIVRKTLLICVTIAGAMLLVPPAQYCFAVQTTMELTRLLNGNWTVVLLLVSILLPLAGYLVLASEGGFWPRFFSVLSICGLVELILIRGIDWLAGSFLVVALLGTLWRPLNWAKLLGAVCLFLVGVFLSIPQFFDSGHWPPGKNQVIRDLRSMATALEAYQIDHDSYPASTTTGPYGFWQSAEAMPSFADGVGVAGLTTPVAYLTSYFEDPFCKLSDHRTFAYYCNGPMWILISAGPDCRFDIPPDKLNAWLSAKEQPLPALIELQYDPTNGAFSAGDLFRWKQ